MGTTRGTAPERFAIGFISIAAVMMILVSRDARPRTTGWALLLPDGAILPIADAMVIGRARFQVVDGRLFVRDLDPSNGTVIMHATGVAESGSTTGEKPLAEGDRLAIGHDVLTVQRCP